MPNLPPIFETILRLDRFKTEPFNDGLIKAGLRRDNGSACGGHWPAIRNLYSGLHRRHCAYLATRHNLRSRLESTPPINDTAPRGTG
jgi:hypothetical protein